MPTRKNTRGRKPHRRSEEIAEILAAYEASEMTQTAFVAQRGIPLSTFQLWRRKASESVSSSVRESTKPSFIEVMALADEQDGFEVHWPDGVRLRVPSRFHEQSLKALLELLHSRTSACSR